MLRSEPTTTTSGMVKPFLDQVGGSLDEGACPKTEPPVTKVAASLPPVNYSSIYKEEATWAHVEQI